MLEVGPGITCREVKKPLGVVASITPFNFPFMVPNWYVHSVIFQFSPTRTVPITLACGNTMILKPSEKTPIGGAILAELLEEAGLPKGVFNVVNGAKDVSNWFTFHHHHLFGNELTFKTVEAICDSEGIDAVTFVGSSTVAKIVYERSILRLACLVQLGLHFCLIRLLKYRQFWENSDLFGPKKSLRYNSFTQ